LVINIPTVNSWCTVRQTS